ncbi:MAG: hypothetical protein NC320_03275 [Clostridium sp.]|nr:hypothetical protein [Clostridium sp.]
MKRYVKNDNLYEDDIYDTTNTQLEAISCAESDSDDEYWKSLGEIYWGEFGDN